MHEKQGEDVHMASIEHRGNGKWRIGVQMPSNAGKYSRRWVRRTITLPPGLTDAEQRRRLEIEAMRLEVDVADGTATPDAPYGTSAPAAAPPAYSHAPSALPTYPHTPSAPPAYPQTSAPTPTPTPLPTVAPPISPSDMTVRQLYDIWMTTHVQPTLKPSTVANYRYFGEQMLRDIGDMPINALTPAYLQSYMATLSQRVRRSTASAPDPAARTPISARTLQHYYDTLSYMLAAGVRMQLLYYNPMERVVRPRAPKRMPTAIDDEHAVALLRELTRTAKPMLTVSVLLALMCGLRLGEVCALTWDDIDLSSGRMTISRALYQTPASGPVIQSPKSSSSMRVIELPPALIGVLRDLRTAYTNTARILGQRWRGNGRIICGWDGTPVYHDTPSKWWSHWARAHGYAGVRYHDLRHTHACILLTAGIDVASVAQHMGHSSPETTLRHYADAMSARDHASAQVMQSVLTDALPSRD